MFRISSPAPGRRVALDRIRLAAWCAALLVPALPLHAQTGSTVPAGQSEVQTVGDLNFQITALRVAKPSNPARRGPTNATITLAIRNQGAQPVFLNARKGSAVLSNELGYRWGEGIHPQIRGIDVSDGRSASLDHPIAPGAELRVQYALRYSALPGQTIGSVYSFSAEFDSLQDLGEGRLRKLREYAVVFDGLQNAGFAAGAADALSGGVDDVMGTLFGKRRQEAP